jgi:hypothetical protein
VNGQFSRGEEVPEKKRSCTIENLGRRESRRKSVRTRIEKARKEESKKPREGDVLF